MIPFLTEAEWEIVGPLYSLDIMRIKEVREREHIGLSEAIDMIKFTALKKYNEITGFDETNFEAVWHHRDSLLGPDCDKCGKPYRTAKARYCAECGDGMDKIP